MDAPKRQARGPADAAGLERLVSELWCEALGLPEVNPSDNFFDLGGHSLLAHSVRDALHTRLGRDVPLIDLFQHPTVRDLAAHLAATAEGGGSRPGPAAGRRAGTGTGHGRRTAAPFPGGPRGGEEDEEW
ncbi:MULTISPECIES: acyl carrier protein [unclassified Streptomyces]|uniref:acyl carrier protein n=1 Tax=unclassified Streptomyces TaxID=2593676 RepID=UPI0033335375